MRIRRFDTEIDKLSGELLELEAPCSIAVSCLGGASIPPNPRLTSFRKNWAPMFPNCFLLKPNSIIGMAQISPISPVF